MRYYVIGLEFKCSCLKEIKKENNKKYIKYIKKIIIKNIFLENYNLFANLRFNFKLQLQIIIDRKLSLFISVGKQVLLLIINYTHSKYIIIIHLQIKIVNYN